MASLPTTRLPRRAGFSFENLRLTFREGRIVHVQGNDAARAERIFDLDEGARYVGEFALGVNPYITKPMNNTLFDEKIMGSFHFTPGACYDECDNGNRSALHWDLVCIQTPEYGGGEIWFDDALVRKDGRFVLPELKPLDPGEPALGSAHVRAAPSPPHGGRRGARFFGRFCSAAGRA